MAASPQSGAVGLAVNPNSSARVLMSDESIWKRLSEVGFDEESIKRRDKAALISYIAKLEAEIYHHQHHMGLLILERKEWVSKYEQIKAAAESAELKYKLELAAHSSDLAEAKKREDNLKKLLGIEKECVLNIEKALHEMRAECAETKVASESKLSEAQKILDDAQKKFIEAEAKLHAAESSEADAKRYHRAAERKLHEVEAREDDLRRHMISFKSDCDAKEKEILLERQSLSERQKALQQSQDRLLDGQASLNQREEYILSRSQELNLMEKELEASKSNIEEKLKVLSEEKTNLELKLTSLSGREEAVIKRECELSRKEEELLIRQEKLASREADGLQQIKVDHEASLKTRKSKYEAELVMMRKLVEDEIETKRRTWELKEVELNQRQDFILEKEHEFQIQSRALADKENDLEERFTEIVEKEKIVASTEKELESKKALLQKEKEYIESMRFDLQKSLESLEDKRKQIHNAEENVEAMKNETNELRNLEKRLKEEIDMIRAQKLELEIEADELKAEKANFETEWELIDEKRKELQEEAKRIAEERSSIDKFLKDEHDSLKLQKDTMRSHYKHDLESLSRDREAFMSEMEKERSEWFSQMQKERDDFLLNFEMQKEELENCINKRREEIESYLMEKEKALEGEKSKELQNIAFLKETSTKEIEQINAEMRKLEIERKEINLEREKRDREWAELNNAIEELKEQRQKLENQRELLHVDRGEILSQIEQLKTLEDLKVVPDRIVTPILEKREQHYDKLKASAQNNLQPVVDLNHLVNNGERFDKSARKGSPVVSPPLSAPFVWLKRCADTLLEHTQSSKRRRKQKESEENIKPRLSMQINAVQGGHEPMSLNQNPVGTEETTVYIDKIITVEEMTSVDTRIVTEDKLEDMPEKNDEKVEDNGDFRSRES